LVALTAAAAAAAANPHLLTPHLCGATALAALLLLHCACLHLPLPLLQLHEQRQ
jgi:hypothetical protein